MSAAPAPRFRFNPSKAGPSFVSPVSNVDKEVCSGMPSKKCEHGRQSFYCKECGGSGICEHNKRRHTCKKCDGSSICEHNKMRSECKECGGSQICEHNRIRSRCSRCQPDTFYRRCRDFAAIRRIPFELSLEEFKWIVSDSCIYCGESFAPMTCDRVDSDRGYRFDNCQPLCDMCNRMKLYWPEEEFERHIIKIIQHRPELTQRAGFPIQVAA